MRKAPQWVYHNHKSSKKKRKKNDHDKHNDHGDQKKQHKLPRDTLKHAMRHTQACDFLLDMCLQPTDYDDYDWEEAKTMKAMTMKKEVFAQLCITNRMVRERAILKNFVSIIVVS